MYLDYSFDHCEILHKNWLIKRLLFSLTHHQKVRDKFSIISNDHNWLVFLIDLVGELDSLLFTTHNINQNVVHSKTFTENWVSKQSFFVLILTTAQKIFFLGINFFVFQDRKLKLLASVWKRISWNLTKFQLNQTTDRKNVNNNCLN